MSSSVYIPSTSGGGSFTPPASISVKTASYTIPAGRYARITANLEGSATLTINGTTAIRGTQNSVLGNDNLRVYTDGNSNTNLLWVYTPSSGGTPQAVGTAFTEAIDQKTVVAQLFLPTGTVISGTGTWRVVVEEYTI